MLKEIVKPINGFDGYFVSNKGVVYCNLGRGNRRTCRRVSLYSIKGRETPMKYLRVYMRSSETGRRVDRYIHRLVGEAFLDKPIGKDVINHKNCNRCDNRVENLEWVTAKENALYSFSNGHLRQNPTNGRIETGEGFDWSSYCRLPKQ